MQSSWSPASWMASMSQSIHASTSSSRGAPDDAGFHPRPLNFSSPFIDICRQTASWSSARMFTQNEPASRMPGHDDEPLPAQNPTSAGSSDTEKNEPTANPVGFPSPAMAVMTV